ncbi:hypothetical protein DLNHIDIE_02170 [Acidithiobacillus thiooxidans ATCC 19377]|jgi:uncharacterized protein involved in oxidation of intracellular sulfur|uniref:Uncharacterized protein n=1 Tax=Acidithiobacillus thiooxidans ATCC 19377 TaxID=637390 RepID=A0A543Q7I1_ACITH|nr:MULTISPECIES: hypothetical protein [Acidithiobacillus]MDX5936212.1 hypothetical protein [Acidithiobacillus thiooxidans]TQN52282.1 hypothetical protein DLNHIDIE_02170 [Acidithiobacillus thiooxidans ATCC 19377]
MSQALVILHASPDEENPRADTAVRPTGAMLADNKDVRLFLAGRDNPLNDRKNYYSSLLTATKRISGCCSVSLI